MTSTPVMSGEEIFRLIPQRPPMTMVDSLYGADEESAETGLTVTADNPFCIGGSFVEPGIIEHCAQSAAVFAGYSTYLSGEAPHIGMIGEIKHFEINRLPLVGESLRTRIEVIASVMNTSLIRATSHVGEEKICEGQLKIFIEE